MVHSTRKSFAVRRVLLFLEGPAAHGESMHEITREFGEGVSSVEVREFTDVFERCDPAAEVFVICYAPEGMVQLYAIRDVTSDSGLVFIKAETARGLDTLASSL